LSGLAGGFGLFLILFALAGCHSARHSPRTAPRIPAVQAAPAPAAVPADTPAPTLPAPAVTATSGPSAPAATHSAAVSPIRIKAGRFSSFTDSDGNVWLPDEGFTDGDTTNRSDDLPIANTEDPELYRTERDGMTAFSYPVSNGRYVVKLHFAETSAQITGAGQRVFSFTINGQNFENFDIWIQAGGSQRAYVETVNVEVAGGKIDMTFSARRQKPEINGIEILPAP